MLPRHARCVLSRLHCNGHSLLLGSYLSRIGRIEISSCSACGHSSQDISHLILHCPATDSLRGLLFVSLLPLVQTLKSCPASGAPWSSAMPPSLGRGRVNNNNNVLGKLLHYSLKLVKHRFGGSHFKMPLYRYIKPMLVAPVDFFCGRKLYRRNLIAFVCVCVCVFCFIFDVFYNCLCVCMFCFFDVFYVIDRVEFLYYAPM